MTIHKFAIALLLTAAMSVSARAQTPGSGSGEEYTAAPEDNAYMWDTIFPDGDLYKAGVGGQGIYISPSTNTIVAYFMTGTGNDGPKTVARTIVNTLGNR